MEGNTPLVTGKRGGTLIGGEKMTGQEDAGQSKGETLGPFDKIKEAVGMFCLLFSGKPRSVPQIGRIGGQIGHIPAEHRGQ